MKLPRDDGFTLTETVAALAVVSMALAGILAATTLVTRHNQRLAKFNHVGRATDELVARLSAELAPFEPFDASDLSGNASGFDYDCAEGRCRFHLPSKSQKLVYVSSGKVFTTWPSNTFPESIQPRLEALILQDLSGTTLGLIRLETEQPEDCQFDMISRTCRGEGRGKTQ